MKIFKQISRIQQLLLMDTINLLHQLKENILWKAIWEFLIWKILSLCNQSHNHLKKLTCCIKREITNQVGSLALIKRNSKRINKRMFAARGYDYSNRCVKNFIQH